ncbi:MAG: GTPase Era [Synergistaceae bacterium]|nr:GTPase Era [Synergistaceae bacterium]MBR1658667.1 GTPase Era [Synergistaceae bacterium]
MTETSMTSPEKCGTVTLIGRPNAGKSSLINALLKTHALIISPKPQTTRNSVRCIYNDGNTQIIFTDTPGLYRADSRDKLGIFLNNSILDALEDSDCILWLIEADTRKLKPDDLEIARILPKKIPVILTANKSDKADPSEAFRLYETLYQFAGKVPVSAKTKRGIDALIQAILPHIPEGEPLYDPDILMDTTEKFMASEIIREKILMLLRDEVPHCVAVIIDDYKSPEEYPDRKKLYIRASLITETEGQKKILIGSKGEMIKRIGEVSRKAIEEVTGIETYLDLWVKAVPNWRRNPAALRRLGYS